MINKIVMLITKEEDLRTKSISGLTSILTFTFLVLFFISYHFTRPNPPFPEGRNSEGFQMSLSGIDGKGLNDPLKKSSLLQDHRTDKEKISTDPNGETMLISSVKKSNSIVDMKKETEAEKLVKKFKKNSGKENFGNANEPVRNTSPAGSSFGAENEGNKLVPNYPEKNNGMLFDLKQRTIVVAPKLSKDTKEEGKVVVDISVDPEGNVIEANPNGRGTTTSSAVLKAKAKQAAFATKFNVDGKFEEQTGTITIVFSFD
jgi:colicin import membrane protein